MRMDHPAKRTHHVRQRMRHNYSYFTHPMSAYDIQAQFDGGTRMDAVPGVEGRTPPLVEGSWQTNVYSPCQWVALS